MRMSFAVRRRYLRLLLPAGAAMLVIAAILLWIGGFGFPKLFAKPKNLAELRASEWSGSYVTLPVEDVEHTYGYLGYQDDEGNAVASERFCLYEKDGKYLVIRLTEEFIPLMERYDDAEELVYSGEVGSLMEVDFGDLTGTINLRKNFEAVPLLRKWLLEHWIDAETMTDTLSGADLSGYAGAANGDFEEYLKEAVPGFVLETGYRGTQPLKRVRTTFWLAVLFVVLFLLLMAGIFAGLFEKPMREAKRVHGRERLEADFRDASLFGPALRIGRQFVWISGTLKTTILPAREFIWAYPRNRRMDGGGTRRSLVLKTVNGKEYSVRLTGEHDVERAIGTLANCGFPLVVGYDKEKQKLYSKDLPAFRGRAANGTLQ